MFFWAKPLTKLARGHLQQLAYVSSTCYRNIYDSLYLSYTASQQWRIQGGGPQGAMAPPPPKRWTNFFFTLSYTNH